MTNLKRRTAMAFGALTILAGAVAMAQSNKSKAPDLSKEWPTYGHDPGGMRFSPLTEITPANVAHLKVAWVYHMALPAGASGAAGGGRGAFGGSGRGGFGRGAFGASGAPQAAGDVPATAQTGRGRGGRGGGNGFAASEVTPLVIDGVMYITTPQGPCGGHRSRNRQRNLEYADAFGRVIHARRREYWPGDSQTSAQIVFGSRDGKLYSVDAKTGKLNNAFGDNGVVNLDTPEITHGLPGNDGMSSPPVIYKNLVITGGTTQEVPALGPAGDVRAWDMHTGKLVWTFHSIPGPGEKFHDTWAGDSWKNRSGVNVWGFITVDAQRGIVYMPFVAPSVDQYGGDRVGNNLFGTSLVAADANTGKYLWHFQVVHHDIWDGDMTGAAALIDVKQGRCEDHPRAVAAINKLGMLFLLNRVTGQPIYGVEERPVPASEVPLERASKTQPFPLKPPPLVRMSMSAADIATVTPELEAACKKLHRGGADGRTLSAARLQSPARSVSRQPWRRELVRNVVQSTTRLSVRQQQRIGAAVRPERSRSQDRHRKGARRRQPRGSGWPL